MTVLSGRKCAALLRNQSQLGCWVKTCLESSAWNSTVCFLIWKISATPRGRLLFQLAPLMPRTDATGYGYLLPTPTANQAPNKNANTNGPKTTAEVARTDWMPGRMWSTPTVRDSNTLAKVSRGKGSLAKGNQLIEPLPVQCGGTLNPEWVEWLMGYPKDWTVLKDSATPSCRKSPPKSSKT
jgi:hypothetical protein